MGVGFLWNNFLLCEQLYFAWKGVFPLITPWTVSIYTLFLFVGTYKSLFHNRKIFIAISTERHVSRYTFYLPFLRSAYMFPPSRLL